MVCSLPFGIAIAMALARGRFWGQSLLNGARAPAADPAAGRHRLLLLLAVRPARARSAASWTEHFGIVFSFRWTGAALACGVMGFPLMVRAIRLSIEAVDAGWRRRPARSAPAAPGSS